MSSRPIAFMIVLVLAAFLASSCSQATAPRVVEYEPGKFYFDWDETDRVTSDAKRDFRRRFSRRVLALRAKLQEPVVVEALRESNRRDRAVQLSEIMDRDRAWVLAKPDDPIIAKLTSQACNEALRQFKAAFPGFAEIFVTNERGSNVCITNKTSDYYQADEDWWQDAFRKGEPINGRLQFDESAGVVAVPAYVPALDPATQKVIGIAKALITQDMQLEQK